MIESAKNMVGLKLVFHLFFNLNWSHCYIPGTLMHEKKCWRADDLPNWMAGLETESSTVLASPDIVKYLVCWVHVLFPFFFKVDDGHCAHSRVVCETWVFILNSQCIGLMPHSSIVKTERYCCVIMSCTMTWTKDYYVLRAAYRQKVLLGSSYHTPYR